MYPNIYTEARSRIFDTTLWLEEKPFERLKYAHKDSPESCKTPATGWISYPVCPFCGVRVGSDNKEAQSGDFCHNACRYAFHMKFSEMDYREEEAREQNRLNQLTFKF